MLELIVKAGDAQGMGSHALRTICAAEDDALKQQAVALGADERVFKAT